MKEAWHGALINAIPREMTGNHLGVCPLKVYLGSAAPNCDEVGDML